MEQQYLDLLRETLEHGEPRQERTGAGTRSLFARSLRYDLAQGFPLLTTKKMSLRSIAAELLWFLEGSGDERRLAEIMHGTREGVVTIWTPNALAPYWKPKAKFSGDLGRVYGVQWRSWRTCEVLSWSDQTLHTDGSVTYSGARVRQTEHDQVKKIIHTLKTNPTDRRMVLSAWNPGELDQQALPPCHLLAQFWVNQRAGTLSCQMYQRSADLFLGVPYNIASYALLTHMIAQVCGLRAGELILTLGDVHIYDNHQEVVQEQLTRHPLPAAQLRLDSTITDIDKFALDSIQIVGYASHGALRASMAV